MPVFKRQDFVYEFEFVQNPTDETLLEQAGAGDRRAAAALIRRHSPRLLGLASRMLNDPVEAEDVVQDAFIRIWRAAPKWKSNNAKVSTWMYKIAVNLCLDRLRKPKTAAMENAPEQRDESATPPQAMEARERAEAVRDAMQTLPDRQRAALSLCYFQDLSNIEAAQIMDVSVEALESLLARGRRTLKTALMDAREDLLAHSPQGAASGFSGAGRQE